MYNFYLYVYETVEGTDKSIFKATCEDEKTARTMAEFYSETGRNANIISNGKLIAHYDAR